MITRREVIGDGGCVAWYPQDDNDKYSVLVWVAPADGAWAVYLEQVAGDPRRYAGLGREEAEAVARSVLEGAGWHVPDEPPGS